MVWTLLPFGLVVILVAGIVLTARALPTGPVCSSQAKLPGPDILANCLAGDEDVAPADKP